jgi:hypothetical protein
VSGVAGQFASLVVVLAVCGFLLRSSRKAA